MSLGETKKAMARTAKAKTTLAAALTELLPPEVVAELTAEGVDLGTAALVVLVARHTAAEADAVRARSSRSPLTSARYARVLSRGMLHALTARKGTADWHAIERDALHSAYMAGVPAVPSPHATHPGSAKGRLVLDARNLAEWCDSAGNISAESVDAKVRGFPRPEAKPLTPLTPPRT